MHSHRTFSHLLQAMGEESFDDDRVRHAAWVARCVGRGATAPLGPGDLTALSEWLTPHVLPAGTVVFAAETPSNGVWIVRRGQLELSVGSDSERAVVGVLCPGDVDGDIALLLATPPPYTARTRTDAECLFLSPRDFDTLLTSHPAVARRWLTSVAQRLALGRDRLIAGLGSPLPVLVAQLLLDEAVDGSVRPTPRTLAAMLGTRRPELHKVLEEFERHGLIRTDTDNIAITDADGLRQLTAKALSR
ncbi:Crp/Fnr family transcriptional regulator [Nocardia neocaledoniensis]|uniref:Crp/Fnr family transcriptional regulator n=1 Tax=Nocardia neocaledoniensis TaxID=236511 RepID=UPI0033CC5C3F